MEICVVPPAPRGPRSRRSSVLVLSAAAVASLLLSACGGSEPSSAGGGAASSSARAGGQSSGGGADNGGGEQAGTTYQSARFHYRVDAPGQMTEAADGSSSAQRGSERMQISVVTGAAAGDPAALAKGDFAQLGQASKVSVMSPLGSTSLAGRSVEKVVYSTSGTNPVTGRSEDFVAARYYIPRDRSTLAILTYSIASNQYDPQGADDVAATFRWQ